MSTEFSNHLLVFARALTRVETFLGLLDLTAEQMRRATGAGYSLVVVKNGQEAVAASQLERFDLMVLDVIMPGMSCQDSLKQLRANQPDVRVLLSSGYTADTNVAELL